MAVVFFAAALRLAGARLAVVFFAAALRLAGARLAVVFFAAALRFAGARLAVVFFAAALRFAGARLAVVFFAAALRFAGARLAVVLLRRCLALRRSPLGSGLLRRCLALRRSPLGSGLRPLPCASPEPAWQWSCEPLPCASPEPAWQWSSSPLPCASRAPSSRRCLASRGLPGRSLLGGRLASRRLPGRSGLACGPSLCRRHSHLSFCLVWMCRSPWRRTYFTAALNLAPAENLTPFDAGIWTISPVRGLRPCRAERCDCDHDPKPGRVTLSPLATAPWTGIDRRVQRVLGLRLRETTALGDRIDELGLVHAPSQDRVVHRVVHRLCGMRKNDLPQHGRARP